MAQARRAKPAQLKLSRRSAETSDALLAAVLADPDAVEPRLVYADFLQQRGDPRGELISVQCMLAQLPEKDRRRVALAAREKALLDEHGKAWSAHVVAGKLELRRGFGEKWKVTAPEFAKHAAAMFAREPIRIVDLSQGNVMDPLKPGSLAAFSRPELARVKRLELRRLRFPVEDVKRVFACRHLTGLEELDAAYMPMSRGAVEALTTNIVFVRLRELSLRSTKIDVRAIGSLAAAPYAAQLRVLDVSSSTLGDDGVIALANTRELAGLVRLDLWNMKLRDQTADALVASPNLANLEYLNVAQNRFSAAARRRLMKRFGKRAVAEP